VLIWLARLEFARRRLVPAEWRPRTKFADEGRAQGIHSATRQAQGTGNLEGSLVKE